MSIKVGKMRNKKEREEKGNSANNEEQDCYATKELKEKQFKK